MKTCLLALLLTIAACFGQTVQHRGVVATVHPLATDAAINSFKRGGNAIDAAVAAALTLGVVDSHNSGIGGSCFMLIRLANGASRRWTAARWRRRRPRATCSCATARPTRN